MASFYSHLNSGNSKSAALAKAKQHYLETAHPSRLHPYYWAGFVLVGDESAVWSKELNLTYLALALAALLIIAFGYKIYTKTRK